MYPRERKLTIRILGILIYLLILSIPIQSQSSQIIDLQLPIHGYGVFFDGNRLFMIDTFLGEVNILSESERPNELQNIIWNTDGTQIAYNDRLDTVISNPFTAETPIIFPYDSQIGFFTVEDWDHASENLFGIGGDTQAYTVSIFNLETQEHTILLRYIVDDVLSENPNLQFREIKGLSANPVFHQWVLIEIETLVIETENDIEPEYVTFVMAYNAISEETYLIDAEIAYMPDMVWSDDGREIIIPINREGSTVSILEILDNLGNWNPQSPLQATGLFQTNLLGWFGVDDLFLLRSVNPEDTHYIYEIGRLINNEIVMLSFFTIDRTELGLNNAIVPLIRTETWHFRPNDIERTQLNCLFDNTDC